MNAHRTPDPVDGTEVVHRHWPLDGPHTPESVAAAGDAVAELNRYLARATRGGRVVLPYAEDGYRLVGSLRAAAASQAQVYRQLGRWADTVAADRGLREDEHRDHERAVELADVAGAWLADADDASTRLAQHLERAQAPLGHLYHEMDWGLDR